MSVATSWSVRSPGRAGWCGAIVLSLTVASSVLPGRSSLSGAGAGVSTESAPAPSRRAEPPLTRRVLLARRPQVPAVEVRPEGVEEDELGVGRLPQQEVAGPVLLGAAHEQVDVGHVGLVEVPGDGLLVDLVRVEPAGRDLAADRGGGVG